MLCGNTDIELRLLPVYPRSGSSIKLASLREKSVFLDHLRIMQCSENGSLMIRMRNVTNARGPGMLGFLRSSIHFVYSDGVRSLKPHSYSLEIIELRRKLGTIQAPFAEE